MRTIVFDIDTQRDFMEPGGGLYVPGAEHIVPALRRVLETARDCRVPVLASMDAHVRDDAEFSSFPPHCVVGTRGQEKIPETALGPWRVVPNVPQPIALREGETLRLEKQTLSLLDAVNFDAALAALRPELALLVGVATEYCVRAAALGLRARGLDVAVVTDAVRAVDPGAGERALGEVRAAGARTIDAAEAVRLLRENGRCAPAPRRGRKR
jgi:nicotinamidase/pyrazinamidase